MTELSGSGRPKNMWIRWSRIRIRNTAFSIDKLLIIPIVYNICFDRTRCHGAVAEGRFELGTFWDLRSCTGKGHHLCWNLSRSLCLYKKTLFSSTVLINTYTFSIDKRPIPIVYPRYRTMYALIEPGVTVTGRGSSPPFLYVWRSQV